MRRTCQGCDIGRWTQDQKLSSGFMLLTFMTTHLFHVSFAVTEQYWLFRTFDWFDSGYSSHVSAWGHSWRVSEILCVKMDFGVRGPHFGALGSPEEYKKLDSSGTDVWL